MKKAVRYSFIILLIASCLIVVPFTLLKNVLPTGGEVAETTTTTESVVTTTTTAIATTTTTAATSGQTVVVTQTSSTLPSTTTKPTTTAEPTVSGTTGTLPDAAKVVSFPDTLFIGDSRTVGLKEYGKLSDATFFCDVGLSSNNVRTKALEVAGYNTITLPKLLESKNFKTVYIMLGINEIGGNLGSIANKYQSIIDLVHEKQPSALVVVQSTLHVTEKRNQEEVAKDGCFNNARINSLNEKLAALANGTNVFYLDMNPMYDDENGHMTGSYAAGDGIHIKAKYYLLWREYLDTHRMA